MNEKNKDMLTPLHLATDMGHHDVMDTLLRLGAKVNALDALGQTGMSPLLKPQNMFILFSDMDGRFTFSHC